MNTNVAPTLTMGVVHLPTVFPTPTAAVPPAVTVSAFIGAAQGKLSLGATQSVPGMQTLQNAIAQGPANKVPPAVLTALQAYMETPQCAVTISNARLAAEFTIAKFNPGNPAVPKLAAPVTAAAVSAAVSSAGAQVPTQRKDVSAHDANTIINETLSSFAPEIGQPLQLANDIVYQIWGDAGVTFVFGNPGAPPGGWPEPEPDPQPDPDPGDPGIIGGAIQTMLQGGGGGDGSNTQDPANSGHGVVHTSDD